MKKTIATCGYSVNGVKALFIKMYYVNQETALYFIKELKV